MTIKVGEMTIDVFNDGYNPANYTIQTPYLNMPLSFHQFEAELLVQTLKVLVEQNKKKV